MAYELPDGFRVLSPTPVDSKLRVNTLSDILNDPTYNIGMAPIFAVNVGKHYKITGGSAGDGWVFKELTDIDSSANIQLDDVAAEGYAGNVTQKDLNITAKAELGAKEDDLGYPADSKSVLTSDTDGSRSWINLLSAIQPPLETLETSDTVDTFTLDFANNPVQKVYTIDADRGFTIDIQNMPTGDILLLNVRVCTPSTISVRFPAWTFIMNAGDGTTAEVQTFPFSGFTNKTRDGVALTDYLFRTHMIVLIKHYYPKSFNINSTPGVPKVGQEYYTFHTAESGDVAFNKQ